MAEQATGQFGQIAVVAGNDGDRVLVSLPLVGFPPGYQLRPGDQVVVVHEANGPAVRPLVRARVLPSPAQDAGGTLMADNESFAVQPATQRDERGDGPEVLFVIERDSAAEGQPNVVAVRRERS